MNVWDAGERVFEGRFVIESLLKKEGYFSLALFVRIEVLVPCFQATGCEISSKTTITTEKEIEIIFFFRIDFIDFNRKILKPSIFL